MAEVKQTNYSQACKLYKTLYHLNALTYSDDFEELLDNIRGEQASEGFSPPDNLLKMKDRLSKFNLDNLKDCQTLMVHLNACKNELEFSKTYASISHAYYLLSTDASKDMSRDVMFTTEYYSTLIYAYNALSYFVEGLMHYDVWAFDAAIKNGDLVFKDENLKCDLES